MISNVRHWTIYKITNPIGKIYIGRTNDFHRRIVTHFSPNPSWRNKYLGESIAKYGKEGHKSEIIDAFESDSIYANGKEIFWIRSYMANINKWPNGMGMNQTDGGKSLKSFRFSQHSNNKRSDSNRGKHLDTSHLLKYNLGVKRSQQIKNAISEGLKKPILMYDLDMNFIQEFNSIDEAYLFLGKKKCGHISAVCNGKRENIYKRIFKYKIQ